MKNQTLNNEDSLIYQARNQKYKLSNDVKIF